MHRDLVSLVDRLHVIGVDLVVGDVLLLAPEDSGLAKQAGIQVEGTFQPVAVEKLNEPDILGDAVIIGKGNGLFLSAFRKSHGLISFFIPL